jgi:hypothetical protein
MKAHTDYVQSIAHIVVPASSGNPHLNAKPKIIDL